MSVKIIKKDTGYGALLKRIGFKEGEVTVGVHEEEGGEVDDESDLTVAEIAIINEFGGPENNPPERSWLRGWYDENDKDNRKKLQLLMAAVVEGKIPSKKIALEQFGTLSVAEIQKRIRDGIDPENADRTIENKGSSTPLIDSGQFWGSVSFRVET